MSITIDSDNPEDEVKIFILADGTVWRCQWAHASRHNAVVQAWPRGIHYRDAIQSIIEGCLK